MWHVTSRQARNNDLWGLWFKNEHHWSILRIDNSFIWSNILSHHLGLIHVWNEKTLILIEEVSYVGFWQCWDICSFVEIIKHAFQWYQHFINWSPTFEDTRTSWCIFLIMFFIFYTLFCPISQNKPGRHKVTFVVMRHILPCTTGTIIKSFLKDTHIPATYSLFIYLCAATSASKPMAGAVILHCN